MFKQVPSWYPEQTPEDFLNAYFWKKWEVITSALTQYKIRILGDLSLQKKMVHQLLTPWEFALTKLPGLGSGNSILDIID